MRKLGTEQKIDNDNFTLKIGTTDKNNPLVIYAEYGMFIEPKTNGDFVKRINQIKNKVSCIGKNISSCGLFSKDIISIADVSIDRLCLNKKSFLSIQYYFRNSGSHKYHDMSNAIKDGILEANNEFVEFIESNGFSCSKKKS